MSGPTFLDKCPHVVSLFVSSFEVEQDGVSDPGWCVPSPLTHSLKHAELHTLSSPFTHCLSFMAPGHCLYLRKVTPHPQRSREVLETFMSHTRNLNQPACLPSCCPPSLPPFPPSLPSFSPSHPSYFSWYSGLNLGPDTSLASRQALHHQAAAPAL